MYVKPPTMKQINAAKKDWRGISLFAGCGGSSTGHKMAGIDILLANEFVDQARESYEANHPTTKVVPLDIRRIDPKKILQFTGLGVGELDLLDGSPPCFPAGTLITTNRGLVPIEEVTVNDQVLTHKQRMKPVTELLPKIYQGPLYKIKAHGSFVEATDEHPIYARLNKGGKINRNLQAPKWVAAEDMTTDHYVGIPTRYTPRPYVWEGVPRVFYHRGTGMYETFENINTLPVDSPDFWWIVGRWLGDGWIRFVENEEGIGKARKKARHSTFICCDSTDNDRELAEITTRLDRIGFKYNVRKHRTSYRIGITCESGGKELATFFRQFGKGATNKEIPAAVTDLPRELLSKVLSGYMSADGTDQGNGNYRYSSVSQKLALGIAQIVARLYRIPVRGLSGVQQHESASYIEGRKVNCNTIYVGSFNITPDMNRVFYEVDSKDIIWVPVKSIEQRDYHGPVYNFSVATDETYVANNLIVHNCKAFSTAGVQDSGWGREVKYSGNKVQQVDDLFSEFTRMLGALQPKCFTAENVSGLVKGVSKGYFIETMKEFKALGYKVRAIMMNSAWLGVPQSRERIIFMGVRDDLGFDVPDIVPLDSICNLSDALPHLAKYKTTVADIITYVPACNGPFPTVTSSDAIAYETARFSAAGFVEDLRGKRRKLTIDELKVISGVPSDYILTGTFEQQWERLGRICVPQMTCAASTAFIEHVLKPYAKKRKKKPGQIFR